MEESAAQKQARLRREKREKKILQGGTSRLDKITSLAGRSAPEPDAGKTHYPQPLTLSAQELQGAQDATPASSHSISTNAATAASPDATSAVNPTPPAAAEANAAIRQLFRQASGATSAVPEGSPNSLHNAGATLPQADTQDPVQQLLQQMMGAPPDASTQPGLAAGGIDLQKLFSGATSPSMQQPTTQGQKLRASVWRVLHPLLAFALGLYIHQAYVFEGTLTQRTAPRVEQDRQANLFWLFATVELVLQSTRYVLERGLDQPGMLTTVADMLPEPWRGRTKLVARHKGIWTTLVSDGLVVIWVLGVAAWWQRKGGE